MKRALAICAAVLVALLVASQVAIPPLAERAAEHRLTKDGGHANVSLGAFPALRLLAHRGDRISVTGSGLHVDLTSGVKTAFRDLDGFGQVHVHLTDVAAGPFAASAFSLDRPKGSHTYSVAVRASFTPGELSGYLGSQFAGGLGGLIAGVAGGLVGGSQPVPVDVRAQLESQGGKLQLVSGAGSVAGVPMGPLLELVATAVVARL